MQSTEGVLANDTDPDNDPISSLIVRMPNHGSLAFGTDGSFAYTPYKDYNGPDNFIYRASDSIDTSPPTTVDIAIIVENDPPVAGDDTYNIDARLPVDISIAIITYEWILEGANSSSGPIVERQSGKTTELLVRPPVSCARWYRWRVRAIDEAGNPSAYSEDAHFITVLP